MYQRDHDRSSGPSRTRSHTRQDGGGAAQRLLGPHSSAGNAAIQRMAPALGLRLAAAPRALQRCGAGGCTCGGSCGGHEEEFEEELRVGCAALQRAVADRRMIARDQDPGPPEAPDWWGIVCGTKDGKPYCTFRTPKGEVEVDLATLTPEQRAVVMDPERKNCPPQRWNWFWKNCCKPDEYFDLSQRHCAPVKREKPAPVQEEPWVIPPAPEKHPGDYPLPDEGQAYA